MKIRYEVGNYHGDIACGKVKEIETINDSFLHSVCNYINKFMLRVDRVEILEGEILVHHTNEQFTSFAKI